MNALGRQLFGVCLFLSWWNSLTNVIGSEQLPYSRGATPGLLVRLTPRGWLLIAMTAAFVAAAEAFVLRLWQAAAGACVFVLVAAIHGIEVRQWSEGTVVSLGKYYPAPLALAAYVLAYAASSGAPQALREAAGWEAGCGIMAAAYVMSAWTKWRKAGPAWFTDNHMGLLVAERSYDAGAVLGGLRRFVAGLPAACRVLAAAGFLVEALAFVYVWPPSRWAFTAAATGFQLCIAVLLGYIEWEWILAAVALTMASARPGGGL